MILPGQSSGKPPRPVQKQSISQGSWRRGHTTSFYNDCLQRLLVQNPDHLPALVSGVTAFLRFNRPIGIDVIRAAKIMVHLHHFYDMGTQTIMVLRIHRSYCVHYWYSCILSCFLAHLFVESFLVHG